MITISEKTPPKSSYKNILENPMTKEIFVNTLSQLWIQDTTKEAIICEFDNTINNFEDPSYTGDIGHFKANLYTTLSDTNKDVNLVDILSTEEFVNISTKAIENLISISLADGGTVSLEEYVKYYLKNKPEIHHILPVLRWLYKLEPSWEIHRDTSELVAALKKHLITNSTNKPTDSISELWSLVERSKQNESIVREDEIHYNNIKSYTDKLPENPNDYSHMMDKIELALEYFSNSIGYKKEKLDRLMHDFIINLAKSWLSSHWRRYWYLWRDIYSIKYKQKLDIDRLVLFLDKYPEYKELVIGIMNERIINLEKDIIYRKEKIKTFYRPTREERCRRAPYRWAPIKSDQEYSRELGNLKRNLDMDEKNFDLFKTYLLKLS